MTKPKATVQLRAGQEVKKKKVDEIIELIKGNNTVMLASIKILPSKQFNMIKKEVRKANLAIRKAKKEVREAEQETGKAHEKVIDVAVILKGNKRKKFTGAARDLEKAENLAAESCESTEEAESKVKKIKG